MGIFKSATLSFFYNWPSILLVCLINLSIIILALYHNLKSDVPYLLTAANISVAHS